MLTLPARWVDIRAMLPSSLTQALPGFHPEEAQATGVLVRIRAPGPLSKVFVKLGSPDHEGVKFRDAHLRYADVRLVMTIIWLLG